MERYREYKDSGVKWLGKIPSHWEVKRLANFFSERREKVSDQDYAPLSVTKQGIFPQLDNVAKTNDGDNRKLVKRGDFVINSRSDRKGSSGVSELDGSVSLINLVLQPRKTLFGPFCNYLLKSYGFIEENYRNGRGIVADLWTTRYDEMKMIKVALPSLEEQKTISSYLDSATSEIDKAIAMQQKMIDLLNERKQIIIQNAVTKGLDENVEMKESGVEFVNEIPHNWSTRRLKFSAWIRARLGWKGLKASEYVENGYPFLSAFNIENDHMKWNNLNFINKYRYDESPEIKLKIGDLLLVKDGAGIGKCARIDELPYGESTANGSLAVITSYDMLDYRYLYYFMVSKSFKDHTELLINGMGVPHFTQGEMKKIVMPVPPQAEQQQIVTYLDSKMQRFDTAITNCQRQITLLQERKQIIINEVVTGKVRVS